MASAVHVHAAMLRNIGARVTVVALEDAHSEEDRAALGDVPLLTVPVTGPGFFGFAPDLTRTLLGTNADILHLHGIWMYPSRAASEWARRTGRPYLISPHGMLDPWITARGKWKKALARQFYERTSWRRASAFHALTVDEAVDIGTEAGEKSVLTIPNAGPQALADPSQPRGPCLVYLGRIHPKKNIGALIDAWELAALPANAELVVAGWGAAEDVAELETRVARAADSVSFIGPAHGKDKQQLLESARFLILPSFSEGLPMVILEAWAAGTPTIMTKACHLPEGFASGAALECATDVQSLAGVIERALLTDENAWARMSASAVELAGGPFSADAVAARWADAYAQLVGKVCA